MTSRIAHFLNACRPGEILSQSVPAVGRFVPSISADLAGAIYGIEENDLDPNQIKMPPFTETELRAGGVGKEILDMVYGDNRIPTEYAIVLCRGAVTYKEAQHRAEVVAARRDVFASIGYAALDLILLRR